MGRTQCLEIGKRRKHENQGKGVHRDRRRPAGRHCNQPYHHQQRAYLRPGRGRQLGSEPDRSVADE